jgi:hypothetical protein
MKNVVKEKPALGAIMGDKTKRTKRDSFSSTMLMAAKARAACNSHTREQREAGVNRAMSLIYGSASAAHGGSQL